MKWLIYLKIWKFDKGEEEVKKEIDETPNKTTFKPGIWLLVNIINKSSILIQIGPIDASVNIGI